MHSNHAESTAQFVDQTLWKIVVYPIARLGWLKKVWRRLRRYLMLFRPRSYVLKIAADMTSIEVHKGLWVVHLAALPPHLTKDSNVDAAHELLSYDVETVC